MSWSSNNGREDSPGGVISSKSSFAHPRSIVNHKSGNLVVTHFALRVKDVQKLQRIELVLAELLHETTPMYSALIPLLPMYSALIPLLPMYSALIPLLTLR
eukprot:TRINITY_DN126_c0_g1_i3.p1 TRINITY_DN126_c0_g1~~TRINITY_DN126_c0_g1_i3.p1  ORF type:complete len:101 (+),score=15.70 TRINITY_DN126_c0_g1_i3:172-474(+)